MRENMSKAYYEETAAAYRRLDAEIQGLAYDLLKGMSQDAQEELREFFEQLEDLAYSEQVKAEDEAEELARIEQQEAEEVEYMLQQQGGWTA